MLVGIYDLALPALFDALTRHLAYTNPLADSPSVRVCKFARIAIEEMLQFGRRAMAALVGAEEGAAMKPWVVLLAAALSATGGAGRGKR